MPDDQPSVSSVLRRAADLIEKPGAWTRGAFSRGPGGVTDRLGCRAARNPVCFCVRGALIQAAFGGITEDSLLRASAAFAAEEFVCRVVGNDHLVVWNDAPGRTQTEVVQALRSAAELADAPSPQKDNPNG